MKDIFKNALTKTKNVMTKILGFLKKKRFSIITLIITLILCLDIYSCLARPNAREPTTANAESRSHIINVPSMGKNVYGSSNIIYSDSFTIYLNDTDYSIRYPLYNGVDREITFTIVTGVYGQTLTLSNFHYLTLSAPYTLNIPYSLYENALDIEYFKTESSSIYFVEYSGLQTQVATNFPFPYTDNDLKYYGFIETVFPSDGSYDEGYDVGYDEGYDVGYGEGLNTSFEDVSPFEVIKSGVDSLLNIPIIGNMTLGNILQIGFGLILLGFIVKVFLGG